MSNSQLEEAMERRRDAYIAKELGTRVELLDEHPFHLDADASEDGLIYSWRIFWDDTAPPGVSVSGEPGSLWSTVQPAPDDPDGSED